MKEFSGKDVAFELYMGGTSQTKIASLLGVSENTVSRWKREDKWDDVKTAIMGGGYKIVAAIYQRVIKELEDKPNTFNMDMLAKAGKSVQIFMPTKNLPLANYQKVFSEFGAWMVANGRAKQLKHIVESQDEFIDEKVNQSL